MAQRPCRQLNSAAIRGEVLANIIPLVRSSCSIIGVKSVWRVQGGVSGIQSSWKHIVSKRNECDAVVCQTPGVAFFFSAISTFQASNKSNSRQEDRSSDEEASQSQQTISSTNSSSEVNQTSFTF